MEHVHDYKEFKLFRITNVHKNYKGTTGDRAFITKQCDCGKVRPIDYGLYRNMQTKMETVYASSQEVLED